MGIAGSSPARRTMKKLQNEKFQNGKFEYEKSGSGKFEYDKSVVFMRDSFIPFVDARVSIASSSFLYGLTIYTVIGLNQSHGNTPRGEKTKNKLFAFRLEDHWKRLVASAKIMDFNTFIKEWNYKRFEKMIKDLVEKNSLVNKNSLNKNSSIKQTSGQTSRGDFLIRISVFVDALVAGTKIHDLPNAVCAYIYPMGEIVPRSGIHVCVSSFRRNPDNAIPSRAKVNGGYVNVALMKNEALRNGYDDALALDLNGFVTEGTVANIFIKKDGALITPPVNSDILEGITRNSIIRIAGDMDIEVVERPIARSELYIAEEAFICGTSARITPVLSIDRRVIGNGKIGDFTSRLAKKYEEIQRGISKEYAGWRKEM